jgi:pilus assembly protein CpaC
MSTNSKNSKRTALGTALAAVLAASIGAAVPSQAAAQSSAAVAPVGDIALSVGTGRMVRFDGTMSDLFVANDKVADVQVRSANQIYIFGKGAGETSVYATNKAGRVIFSANVKVGTNLGSLDELLRLAMPNAQIQATPMNGMVLLTGTVAAPEDVEQAGDLVQGYVGEGVKVVSRLKMATPLQVMLKVKIAEVSRSLVKEIGVNLLSRDNSGGFLFGIGRGAPGTIKDRVSDSLTDPATGNPTILGTAFGFNNKVGATSIGLAGSLLGLDVLSTIDLNEANGRVVTLAEPTLTALSGETASFLAGGEFPIPTAQGLSGTAIEFKEYGVSLAFTPIVHDGGRISMRVRPEVSELSDVGSIKLNGFTIPSLTTRRAETTVELGSGQSFMIGGLLRNSANNSVEKAPVLGDLPVLGALFRSTSFKRNETELVIIVTPYLVKPVNASQIALPSDGYRSANDVQRVLGDVRHDSRTGEQRPQPQAAPPRVVGPAGSDGGSAQALPAPAPAPAPARTAQTASATPGFTF